MKRSWFVVLILVGGLFAPSCASDSGDPDVDGVAALNDWQQVMLDRHNQFRACHGAGALEWSDAVAQSAQGSANRCSTRHSGNPSYGESLKWGESTAQGAVDYWHSEEVNYPNTRFEFYGHFTALVWKSTTQLGCGVQNCGGNVGRMWVCQYNPGGNGNGTYQDNVGQHDPGCTP